MMSESNVVRLVLPSRKKKKKKSNVVALRPESQKPKLELVQGGVHKITGEEFWKLLAEVEAIELGPDGPQYD